VPTQFEREEIKATIRKKIVELSNNRAGAPSLGDDELIPASGLLDSAAVLELVVWFEAKYAIVLREEDVNIDNLGSINAMADFALRSH